MSALCRYSDFSGFGLSLSCICFEVTLDKGIVQLSVTQHQLCNSVVSYTRTMVQYTVVLVILYVFYIIFMIQGLMEKKVDIVSLCQGIGLSG